MFGKQLADSASKFLSREMDFRELYDLALDLLPLRDVAGDMVVAFASAIVAAEAEATRAGAPEEYVRESVHAAMLEFQRGWVLDLTDSETLSDSQTIFTSLRVSQELLEVKDLKVQEGTRAAAVVGTPLEVVTS